jgi:hypothetical protein
MIKVLKSHTYILNLVYEKLDNNTFVSDKIGLYYGARFGRELF